MNIANRQDWSDNRRVSGEVLAPAFVWGAAALAGLATAILFTAVPQIDLHVAELFYLGERHFVLVGIPLGTIPRALFRVLFIGFSALAIFGLARALWLRTRTMGFGFPHWLHIILCLIIGPGLVTNSLLKDHWGRARPMQVEQFGGSAKFTPALTPSTACDRNCSFVSGESSSIFMLFFALAVARPRQTRRLLRWGVSLGLAAGLVRIGMGGHFLSDVLFSGVFMLLTASFIHWVILDRYGSWFAHDGPLHTRLADVLARLRRNGAALAARVHADSDRLAQWAIDNLHLAARESRRGQ